MYSVLCVGWSRPVLSVYVSCSACCVAVSRRMLSYTMAWHAMYATHAIIWKRLTYIHVSIYIYIYIHTHTYIYAHTHIIDSCYQHTCMLSIYITPYTGSQDSITVHVISWYAMLRYAANHNVTVMPCACLGSYATWCLTKWRWTIPRGLPWRRWYLSRLVVSPLPSCRSTCARFKPHFVNHHFTELPHVRIWHAVPYCSMPVAMFKTSIRKDGPSPWEIRTVKGHVEEETTTQWLWDSRP